MTVIPLSTPILPGNLVGLLSTKKGQNVIWGFTYKLVRALGFAEITTVGGIAFPVRLPPDEFVPYEEGAQITIPTGAQVIRTAMKIPAGLVATNGDVLRFAGAITAANVAGTNVALESAVAASTTFAPASVVSNAPWGAFLGVASANTALAGDLALQILSVTPGSPDVAGNAISASASASPVRIPCEVVYAMPITTGPDLADAYPQNRGRDTVVTS